MRAVFFATPIRSEKELRSVRWMMMFCWVLVIGGIVCLDWWVLRPQIGNPIIWHAAHATGVVISFLIGWSLGYKHLIGPTGVVR